MVTLSEGRLVRKITSLLAKALNLFMCAGYDYVYVARRCHITDGMMSQPSDDCGAEQSSRGE
jgi:hypothetical protein